MIDKTIKIDTENPIKDIWNYLSMYKDKTFVERKIADLHKIKDIKKRKNILKQSKQIKYSIIQAKEYFDSANNATIATKPLLLYYGSVALSRPVILLSKDGSYSYDALRKKEKHNHHGLELKKDFLNNESTLSDFLSQISCNVFYKEETPWGNFPLFYDSLLPDVSCLEGKYTQENSNLRATIFQTINNIDKREIKYLKNKSINSLELFKNLPDLAMYFREIGIATNLFPGNMSLNSERKTGIRSNGEIIQQDTVHTYNFVVHELDEHKYVEWFKSNYKRYGHKFNNIADSVIISSLIETEKIGQQRNGLYFPDSVSSIAEELYYIYEPEKYIQESASYFILAYMFGMLCRYYPDIWMDRITNLHGFPELITFFMDIYTRKFPNLILNQLGRKKYVFK